MAEGIQVAMPVACILAAATQAGTIQGDTLLGGHAGPMLNGSRREIHHGRSIKKKADPVFTDVGSDRPDSFSA